MNETLNASATNTKLSRHVQTTAADESKRPNWLFESKAIHLSKLVEMCLGLLVVRPDIQDAAGS